MPGASSPTPCPSPEQRELDGLWVRIRDLREQVVEGERRLLLYLQTLEAFEHDYLLRCGRRYAELDGIRAEIAELHAARDPGSDAKGRAARTARARARRTIRESREREVAGPARSVVHTPETKAVYRKAARLFHPDLARDDPSREICHDYMVQLNAAYKNGDVERIERLVVEWQAGLGPAPAQSVGEQLVDALRLADRLGRRLEALAAERAQAESSDLGRLQADVAAALEQDHDLVAGLIERLDCEIEEARSALEALRHA
jgi:hypothetical protein